ncbi:hypothetical protein [Halococcus agarilyticus]|uniref:hypothetical protein n=1 Tax=Halococcus agarilyticus TaxID=1232219 RepID=UPI0012AB39ED|nr:hypothetical protein [Halococcus agarilyticus]
MSDSEQRYSGEPGRFTTQRGDVRRVTMSIPDEYAEKLEEMKENSDINYDDAHYSEFDYQNNEFSQYVLDILKNHVEEQEDD